MTKGRPRNNPKLEPKYTAKPLDLGLRPAKLTQDQERVLTLTMEYRRLRDKMAVMQARLNVLEALHGKPKEEEKVQNKRHARKGHRAR